MLDLASVHFVVAYTLFVMDAFYMLYEVSTVCERLLAEDSLVSPQLLMNGFHMLCHVSTLGESLFAEGTLVFLQLFMDSLNMS